MAELRASPVVKWAGGKGQLLPELLKRVPASFDTYFEPFAGGAALFFALSNAGRIKRAILSDMNPELLNLYRVLQSDLDGLLANLAPLAENYLQLDHAGRTQFFYDVRARNEERPAAAAARTVFLNRTCYNGLYRVNRSGAFNVPHGRYRRPLILNHGALVAASAALQKAEIRGPADFEIVADCADSDDFVYFDPPYQPLNQTSSFTAYTGEDFGWAQQLRLNEVFTTLARKGASALLSNSAHPAIVSLYGEAHEVLFVQARRAINSKGGLRGPIAEILVAVGPKVRSIKAEVEFEPVSQVV